MSAGLGHLTQIMAAVTIDRSELLTERLQVTGRIP